MSINRTSGACISLLALLALVFSQPLRAGSSQVDPMKSPMWDYMRKAFIGSDEYVFDDRVIVSVPEYAENPMQVPVSVDASALDNVKKIISFADLNPIQHIFTFEPGKDITPKVSMRFKVQQATPVRAAVQTQDGTWYVGSNYLEAAGGGCTAPSTGNGNPIWEDHLGEIKSRAFLLPGESTQRYKFKVIHPMDTGLASNIPEFYIQQVHLKNKKGDVVASLQLSQPVSENPVITFDLDANDEGHFLWMRDNNGNEFEQEIDKS